MKTILLDTHTQKLCNRFKRKSVKIINVLYDRKKASVMLHIIPISFNTFLE